MGVGPRIGGWRRRALVHCGRFVGGEGRGRGVLGDVARENREEVRSGAPGRQWELAIADLARRQHRAAGDDQLLALGLSRDAIRYRIKQGRLQRIHPGVVAIGPGPLHQRGRWWAALLACRPAPALSNLSCAAERGLAREFGRVHITVPRRTRIHLVGVTVHGARHLDPLDLDRSEDGLPMTALHRLMLDLAETLPFHRFEAIFEEADRRELIDLAAIAACMERNPGRRGLAPLGRLLADYLPVDGAGEGLPRAFQRFLAEEGFPPPVNEVLVSGHRVDCFWPEYGFVVELDSRDFHRHWRQQERDRARDGGMLRAGARSLRVTHHRLTHERGELIADLASVLPRTRARAA